MFSISRILWKCMCQEDIVTIFDPAEDSRAFCLISGGENVARCGRRSLECRRISDIKTLTQLD